MTRVRARAHATAAHATAAHATAAHAKARAPRRPARRTEAPCAPRRSRSPSRPSSKQSWVTSAPRASRSPMTTGPAVRGTAGAAGSRGRAGRHGRAPPASRQRVPPLTERVQGARSASLGVFVTWARATSPSSSPGVALLGAPALQGHRDDERREHRGVARSRRRPVERVHGSGADVLLGAPARRGPRRRPADPWGHPHGPGPARERRGRGAHGDRRRVLGSHDDPASIASERFFELVFPSHPLGRDPLGTLSSVAGIDASDVRAFFSRHYGSANLVVGAAGDVDHDHVAALVGGWRPGWQRRGARRGGAARRRPAPRGPPLALRAGPDRRRGADPTAFGRPARHLPRLRPAPRRRALLSAVHLLPRARGPRVPGVLRASAVHRRGRAVRGGGLRTRARGPRPRARRRRGGRPRRRRRDRA